eukprot:1697762-Prorocentrum_lima.AAC.1
MNVRVVIAIGIALTGVRKYSRLIAKCGLYGRIATHIGQTILGNNSLREKLLGIILKSLSISSCPGLQES